jgi:ATP-dependent RNA/DNA helicase IGHMBP2
MPATHPHLQKLIQCINLEEQEQIKRFGLNEQHSLKSLKAEGLAIHPISISQKNFGYADYPEFVFKINYPTETNLFRDGAAIECFLQGEEPIKGILLSLDGNKGECRLFAPDFPDWIEEKTVGIKLAPDQRTNTILKKVINEIEENKNVLDIFNAVHGHNILTNFDFEARQLTFKNTLLNNSQKNAVQAIIQNHNICIVHGPPGTGKTTTLIEAILQLIKLGEKVIVAAPSNTAVDNIASGLIKQQINILRVGNTTKVHEAIFAHTTEGKLANSKQHKEVKELKKRAEEFRRMALKYKRSFGKAEREQRNLLFKEVKNIRDEIKNLQAYNEGKLFEDANVILGTPIGLYDAKLRKFKFNTLLIDEAGQCIEPMAWCIFPLADKYVLAGDHLQLPPTVLSNEATKLGFAKSILETSITNIKNIFLLDTQYRMHSSIAGFSSSYFYEGKLTTAEHLQNAEKQMIFIDTAGSGFIETNGSDGMSLQNEGEIKIIKKLLETENLNSQELAIISPYAGQVTAAKNTLQAGIRISTVDSFQGQEKEIIIVSLVRSNDDGDIGFLKDYRRMNVAITRAKNKLYVIGDSATIGADSFYNAFLNYVEINGVYKTVWEMDII